MLFAAADTGLGIDIFYVILRMIQIGIEAAILVAVLNVRYEAIRTRRGINSLISTEDIPEGESHLAPDSNQGKYAK